MCSCLWDGHRTSASGFAESYGVHRSPDNQVEVHQESAVLSPVFERLDLQQLGLYCHTGPFCHSCLQVDGARTR